MRRPCFTARIVDVTDTIPAKRLAAIPEEYRKKFTQRQQVEVQHRINGSDKVISWGLKEESAGTQQFFALMNSWDGMLHHGRTAVVDELDSSLHSRLSRTLLELIHSNQTNPLGGQLIFTTHDTSLLDSTLMRRDQVYLAEKSGDGATRLYPLLNYSPRKNEALQKGYLAGRYGGIPSLGRFEIAPAKENPE